jgi:hypothetical protein
VSDTFSKIHDRVFVALRLGIPVAVAATGLAYLLLPFSSANFVAMICITAVVFPNLVYFAVWCAVRAVQSHKSDKLKERDEALGYAVNCLFLSFFAAGFAFHLLTKGFAMPPFMGD